MSVFDPISGLIDSRKAHHIVVSVLYFKIQGEALCALQRGRGLLRLSWAQL
jgi:hypothetical protein